MPVETARVRAAKLRLGLWHIADTAALVLFAVFFWRLFLNDNRSFDGLAIGVGLTGGLAAWTRRGTGQGSFVDGPVLIYAAPTLLSAGVHHGTYVHIIAGSDPGAPWQSTIHTAALVIYFYGVMWLLRTSVRIGGLVAAIVLAVNLIGVQTVMGHVSVGIDTRPWGYASVIQWSGYPEIGVLFTVAFAFPLAMIAASGSRAAIAASSLVALIVAVDTSLLYSRAAYLSMGATYAALGIVEVWMLRGAAAHWRGRDMSPRRDGCGTDLPQPDGVPHAVLGRPFLRLRYGDLPDHPF